WQVLNVFSRMAFVSRRASGPAAQSHTAARRVPIAQIAAGILLSAGLTWAQPALIPAQTLPEIPCSVDTSAAAALQMDSVIAENGGPDVNGWMTIFDGRSSRGWWNNCLTPHSNNNAQGG